MLYAILCYDSEVVVGNWTPEQDAKVMNDLEAVQERIRKRGRLGPVARLATTKKAATLRKGASAMLTDGPFAETKEQLLGFYVVDCDSQEEAAAIARELGEASATKGGYEIRPLIYFAPNGVTA